MAGMSNSGTMPSFPTSSAGSNQLSTVPDSQNSSGGDQQGVDGTLQTVEIIKQVIPSLQGKNKEASW